MQNNYDKNTVEELVYPTPRAATLARNMLGETIKMKAEGRFSRSYLPGVDEYLNPYYPGQLISVIGRPANAKTFMSMYTLNETMKELQKTGKPNEACILITTEVSVEVATLQILSRMVNLSVSDMLKAESAVKDKLDEIDNAVYQLMGLPLFIIGHSTQRAKDNRRARPALSPNRINDAMEYILNNYRDPVTDSLIEPKLIVTDYLQRLHSDDRRQNKVDFYSECVDWSKDISLWAGAPHILNVQAKREVDDRAIKIPLLSDGQFTSNIEQSSDFIFAAHMPKVYNIDVMPAFESWNIPQIRVTDNLIYYLLLKQKEGAANKCWVYNGDMGRLKLKLHESIR